jgi:hypothetical protein
VVVSEIRKSFFGTNHLLSVRFNIPVREIMRRRITEKERMMRNTKHMERKKRTQSTEESLVWERCCSS